VATSQPSPMGGSPKVESQWLELVKNVAAIMALMGAFWYGLIYISYTAFFGELGITPSDAGYGYTSTLTSTIGAIAFYGGLTALTFLPLIFAPLTRQRRLILALVIVLYLSIIAYVWVTEARSGARRLINGKPLIATTIGPLRLTTLQALPAEVDVLDKSSNDLASNLAGRSLFYLGQANGSFVVYDSSADEVSFIPSSSVRLRIRTPQ
jgi:hypothetical protein